MTQQQLVIAQLGAPVLRQTAQAITDFVSPGLTQLINDMLYTLENSKGVGLAAPQVNHSVQLLIVASRPTPRYPNAPQMAPVVMINPRFQPLSATKIKDWEGCLSIPGIRALVPRYQAIEVNYQDRAGQFCTLELTDFVARVFQHEYDHLEGLVYLDRIESSRDIISETEFLKLIS